MPGLQPASVLVAGAGPSPASAVAPPRRLPPLSLSAWALLAVAAVAALAAVSRYDGFLSVRRHLWNNASNDPAAHAHDRSAHYAYAQRLALDLAGGQGLALARDLNKARVWPPVHGVLTSLILLVAGLDYRFAVMPSLVGWAGTAVFGFLAARRMAPRYGDLAGVAAALWILASPAHRAFAADVMLESLGACLTLAVLYFYLRAAQDRSAAAGRGLGLALTLLFYHKYNYWLLVALAVAATELSARPRVYAAAVIEAVTRPGTMAAVRAQVRHPLTYLLALALLALAAVLLIGPDPVTVAGLLVSNRAAPALVYAAYLLLFLRVLLWWFRDGRAWAARLGPPGNQLVAWHAWPVALGFLLPLRLSTFLWYLSPANNTLGTRPELLESLGHHAGWMFTEYHPGPAAALIALALFGTALGLARRMRPGAAAGLWLFVIGTALTVSHPANLSRYLHSWVAAGWVAAGAGLAAALAALPRLGVRPVACGLGGAFALAMVGAATAPGLWGPGHAQEGGAEPERASILDVTDRYLDELEGSRRVMLLSSVPIRFLAEWTFAERYAGRVALEEHWFGFGSPGNENRLGFARWLETTSCDALVYVERMADTGQATKYPQTPEDQFLAELRPVLDAQTTFVPVARQESPEHGLLVTVWRRASATHAAAPNPLHPSIRR
jgi:hypothetical protein